MTAENYFIFNIKAPPGMKQADFLKFVDKMQALVQSMTPSENTETTGLLELAYMRQQNTGESFVKCVQAVLKGAEINEKGLKLINSFLAINKGLFLKRLHEFMLSKKIDNLIFQEIEKADTVLIGKGYTITDDKVFYMKKVWNELRDSYTMTLISRGVSKVNGLYVKHQGVFDKKDNLTMQEPDVFAAYVLDLVV